MNKINSPHFFSQVNLKADVMKGKMPVTINFVNEHPCI